MLIEKMTMENFMGYAGRYEVTFPHIGIMCKKNGTGKTSVLAAIRYALTGDKPAGDIINSGMDHASVALVLKNGESETLVIRRDENRDKPNACYLGGKKVTQKNLSDWIESFTHLPLDKVAVISSAEVAAAMNPADFGKFISSYIDRKTSRDDVIKVIPDITEGMKNIITEGLPEEVDLDSLDEFDFFLRDERKSLKRAISQKEAVVKASPDAPLFKKEDIEKQMDLLKKADTDYSVYLANLNSYEKMLAMAESQKKRAEELKKQIAEIKAAEPDEAAKEQIRKDFASAKQTFDNNRTAYTSQKTGLAQLEKELEALSHPGICPLSCHVKCHEDMTPVKTEISDAIAKMKTGINALAAEANKAAALMKKLQEDAKEWQDNKTLWDKKTSLEEELRSLSETVKLPEKPAEVKKPETAEKEAELRKVLADIAAYEKAVSLKAELTKDKETLADTDALVKAVSQKGIVRETIIKNFLSVFDDECARICEGTDYAFRFVSDKGIVPMMKKGASSYLTINELSGGEKAFFMYVIISLLSSLTGSRLLLLDELSVMDSEVFAEFLSLLKAHADEFDTVVLSAVDHPDTLKAVQDAGIEDIVVTDALDGTGGSGEEDESPDFVDIPEDGNIFSDDDGGIPDLVEI